MYDRREGKRQFEKRISKKEIKKQGKDYDDPYGKIIQSKVDKVALRSVFIPIGISALFFWVEYSHKEEHSFEIAIELFIGYFIPTLVTTAFVMIIQQFVLLYSSGINPHCGELMSYATIVIIIAYTSYLTDIEHSSMSRYFYLILGIVYLVVIWISLWPEKKKENQADIFSG